MAKFWELFNPGHGDLVYGRREERDRYVQEYRTRTGQVLAPDAWWTIDQYNNTFGLQMGYKNEGEMTTATEVPAPRGSGPPPIAPQTYRDAMKGVPRRDPRDLYQTHTTEEVIRREGWDVAMPDGFLEEIFQDMQVRSALGYKQIRRACKFGVEFVVAMRQRLGVNGPIIHFIVDGLDDDHVLAKNKVVVNPAYGVSAVPITSSELRNVYRNWPNPAFRNGVKFYFNFEECQPPWVAHPEKWNAYGRSRLAKLENELANMCNDPRLHPFRMEMRELLAPFYADCNRTRQAPDFNALANRIKALQDRLIGFMKHTVQPKSVADILRDVAPQDIKAFVRSAIARYNRRPFLSWQSKETKNAIATLRKLLPGNAAALLGVVHYYLKIEPAAERTGAAGNLGERLSGTGRFSNLLEDEYRNFRFGGRPGMTE